MVAELRNTPRSSREAFLDMLRGIGIEGRGVSRFTDKLYGGSERNPIGFLDLIPVIGGALAMERSGNAAQRGDYFDAALEGLSVLPHGISKAAKKPLGSLKAVLLDRGKKSGEPTFGIVDEFDNSVPTIVQGQVYGDNYGGIIVSSGVPESDDVYGLLDHGVINRRQAADALQGPQLPNSALVNSRRREREFRDDLLLRGLKPGNAVRSGTVFGNSPEKLRLIGAIAQSLPLRNLKGSFTGSRVTGGKQGVRADVPLETARRAAKKRGIGPPENRTVPDVPDVPNVRDVGGYLDRELRQTGRDKVALAKGRDRTPDGVLDLELSTEWDPDRAELVRAGAVDVGYDPVGLHRAAANRARARADRTRRRGALTPLDEEIPF